MCTPREEEAGAGVWLPRYSVPSMSITGVGYRPTDVNHGPLSRLMASAGVPTAIGGLQAQGSSPELYRPYCRL